MNLSTQITQINRVGKTTATRLRRLDIKTVEDLLFYYPWKYDDFSKPTRIEDLESGMRVNIVGTIELLNNKKSSYKKMNITEALISDDSESIKVIWFNQPYISKNLRVGDKVSLSGRVDSNYGELIMSSPVYERIINNNSIHTQGLVPNYHLTANITQKQLRFLIAQIISLAKQVDDWLPINIKQDYNLIDIGDALFKIHFPKSQQDIDIAKARLAFDELFLLQLRAQLIKFSLEQGKALPVKFLKTETKNLVNSLSFKLTNDQRISAWDILQDITKTKPMSRLLEGDVGSGKTIVAVLALFNTAKNNLQSALMVPTEILAKQHFVSLSKLLNNTNVKIALLTGSNSIINFEFKNIGKNNKKKKNKDDNKNINKKELKIIKLQMQKLIINGDIQIVIGTHALIQHNILFKNLNFVVIDEQHRFGVEQRQSLVAKASINRNIVPHLLSMTATPIPRSLALALYDDLDISVIKQMPKNRQKIITQIATESDRNFVYDFIRRQVEQGRQVFVICPLIDWSDKLGVKSVKQEYEKLSKIIFPDFKIAMLHGKLKPKDKNNIMNDFSDNKTNILVSTSVIEVGIDIPNATVMVIEGADRFGLAQLHQYRGRVGRSKHQSYCFLLSENNNANSKKRLEALITYNNGFDLAKADLKFRGPGEVYGTLQKGFPDLKLATLYDFDLMKQAKYSAKSIIKQSNDLSDFPKIKEKIKDLQVNSHHLE